MVELEETSLELERERVDLSVSVSVSLPERSSSQESATAVDFGLEAGFWGFLVETLRSERVRMMSVSEGVV